MKIWPLFKIEPIKWERKYECDESINNCWIRLS
jgi:hypothetical protein